MEYGPRATNQETTRVPPTRLPETRPNHNQKIIIQKDGAHTHLPLLKATHTIQHLPKFS